MVKENKSCMLPIILHNRMKKVSYLPNRLAMTPTLKEPTMPPTLKMETATLQTMVQTPGSISSLYRLYQVTLKKDLSFCRQRWMHRQRMRKQINSQNWPDRRIDRTLWYLIFYVFNKQKITIFKTKIKLESEKSG